MVEAFLHIRGSKTSAFSQNLFLRFTTWHFSKNRETAEISDNKVTCCKNVFVIY